MPTLRSCALSLLTLGAAATTLLCTGCGVQPGDYIVYRVALTNGTQSSGCYPDSTVPPDQKYDKVTLLDGQNFILYAGPEDTYYLDIGSNTLEGQLADDYTFSGQTVDVEYTGANGTGNKVTTSDTTTVQMTVDGDSVTGTLVNKHSVSCKGDTCGTKVPSCSVSQSFVGTEVDVDLQHQI